MSRPQTEEQAVDSEGDSSLHRRDEEGTQSSHRMLGFSDALLSIIATVMVSVGPTSNPPLSCTAASDAQAFHEGGAAQQLSRAHIPLPLRIHSPKNISWLFLSLFL